MRRERMISFFDSLAEITLLILTVFILLIYGSMQVYVPTITAMAAIVCLCAWLMRFLITGRVYWVRTGLAVPLALLAGIAVLHIVRLPAPLAEVMSPHGFSLYQALTGPKGPLFRQVALFPYRAYAGLYDILSYGIIFFVIVNVVYEKEYVNRFLGSIVAVAAALGALWIVQFIVGDFGEVLTSFLNCREDAASLLFNRDYFLWFSVIPFFITVGLLCAGPDREKKSLFAVVAGILFFALLLSGKTALYRGIICGAVFFTGAALITSPVHRVVKGIGAAAIALCGGAFFAHAGSALALLSKCAGFAGADAPLRLPCWSAVVQLAIQKAGVVGAGAGAGQNLSLFGTLSGTSAEMLVIQYGAAGVLACGALIAVYFWKNIRMLLKRKDLFVKMVSIGGMSGIIALLFGGCVEDPFGSTAVLFSCVVFAALVFVLLRIRFADVSENDDGTVYFDVRVVTLRPAVVGLAALAAAGMIALAAVPVVRTHLALYNYRKSTDKIPIESYQAAETPYSSILGFMGSETHLRRREEYLLAAIELDPKNPLYYFELGKFYHNTAHLSKTDHAAQERAAFEKACVLDPFNPRFAGAEGPQKRGEQAAEGPRPREAGAADTLHAAALERLKNSKGSRDALVEALEACRKVVAADPSRVERVLSSCLRHTRDYDLLKAVLRDLRNGPEVLAMFLYNRNVWEANEKKFRKDMRETPNDRRYPYYAALAEMGVQTGDYKGAIALMEEFLSMCPDSPDANFWVAVRSSYYPKQYRQEYTEKYFKKALALEPDNIRYQLGYCKYLYNGKRYQIAADALLALAARAPDNASVLFLLGQCYEKLSSRARALEMYEKALSADPAHVEARSKIESLRK
jgi:tetratricopeptide (TPR) repeat protein